MSKVRVEPVVSDGWLNHRRRWCEVVQMDNFLCISQLVCKWLTRANPLDARAKEMAYKSTLCLLVRDLIRSPLSKSMTHLNGKSPDSS